MDNRATVTPVWLVVTTRAQYSLTRQGVGVAIRRVAPVSNLKILSYNSKTYRPNLGKGFLLHRYFSTLLLAATVNSLIHVWTTAQNIQSLTNTTLPSRLRIAYYRSTAHSSPPPYCTRIAPSQAPVASMYIVCKPSRKHCTISLPVRAFFRAGTTGRLRRSDSSLLLSRTAASRFHRNRTDVSTTSVAVTSSSRVRWQCRNLLKASCMASELFDKLRCSTAVLRTESVGRRLRKRP